MPLPLLAPIAGFLGLNFARVFAVEGLRVLMLKGLVMFALYVALPIILYNVASSVIVDLLQYAVDQAGGGVSGMTSARMQLTGIAGWIGIQINIAGALSVILSAVSVRFAISFIPFIGK